MDESTPRSFYGFYEADLRPPLFSCSKNPGHTRFVPINELDISHLEKDYRDVDLIEFIKARADQTIRISVKLTSTNRPEFWPNTDQPYPFYDKRGSDVIRSGTGHVCDVIRYNWEDIRDKNLGTCKCNKCQHSETPSKVWGEITVLTVNHLVFDEIEARNTTCRLFFDREDSRLITIDGFIIKDSDLKSDKCVMTCITCDVNLLDKLDNMMRHASSLYSRVHEKYKEIRDKDKIAIIISHPHGCPKQVSIGHWIDQLQLEDGSTRVTYTTCTCPGSSGATVQMIGYNCSFSSSHLHCGVNSEGINFSNVGKCVEKEQSATDNEIIAPVEMRVAVSRNDTEILNITFPENMLPTSSFFGDYEIYIKKKSSSSNASEDSACPEKAKIIKHYDYLVEELQQSELVSYLYQEGVLSLSEKIEIENERSNQKRVQQVIDKVISACPTAYHVFLGALEEEHQHVAKRLKESE